MNIEQELGWFGETFEKVRANVAQALVGQNEIVEGVLVSLAANGHVLLEGFPGLGKTLLVRSLASSLDLQFSRIQFTPDLMPADITGTEILGVAKDTGSLQNDKFADVLVTDRPLFASDSRVLLVLQHGSGDNHQTWVVQGKAHWILDNLIAAKKAKPQAPPLARDAWQASLPLSP